MLNRNEFNTMVQAKDRLIQKTNPVYKNPESKIGRAHFYAGTKTLFGKNINTLMFNVFVIWIMTLFLYILLLSNILGSFFVFFENMFRYRRFKKN